MVGGSFPTCVLCTHNGHIRLPFSGADREVRATLFFHAAVVLRISAEAWCHGGGAPQNLRPPLPHRYSPFPSRSSEATHLSFLSLGMAQCLGSELRPGGNIKQASW